MKTTIEVYYEIANKNPVWTPEEEKEAIRKWYDKKDNSKFVNEAFKHNLWLVFKLVGSNAFDKTNEDMFQSAVIGLFNALKSYDPSKGYKISTWVFEAIKWAILKHQTMYSRQGTIYDDIKSINRKYKTNLSVVELDKPAYKNSTNDESDTNGEELISYDCTEPDYIRVRGIKTLNDEVREFDIKEGIYEIVYGKLGKILSKKERFVIDKLSSGMSQVEISRELNVTRMRVSQIVNGAFEKIRKSKDVNKLRELIK